jgi:hypothetical protein
VFSQIANLQRHHTINTCEGELYGLLGFLCSSTLVLVDMVLVRFVPLPFLHFGHVGLRVDPINTSSFVYRLLAHTKENTRAVVRT